MANEKKEVRRFGAEPGTGVLLLAPTMPALSGKYVHFCPSLKLVSRRTIGYALSMKLSPDEIAALADQAVTKYIERKQKRYNVLRDKRSRLKRDQKKQAELSRLATESRGN